MSAVALAALMAVPAAADARTLTTVEVTHGNGPSSAPAISGDERFDRVLAFASDATDLVAGDTNGLTDVFVARNENPDANASHPWRPAGLELISKGLNGEPANGRSYGPAVDGRPGSPPTPPSCVAFVSDASNLVNGDTNGQPDVFVANVDSGAITRVSVTSGGGQADGPSFDVSVDGTCSRVAFSAQAPALGGGATRAVYVRYLSGPDAGRTVVASSQPNASHPSYTSRVNAATDAVAYQTPGAVWVRDFAKGRTRRIAGGGASAPEISEQGTVVAYVRGGRVYTNDRGRTEAISDRKQGTASDPSLGGGGKYVAYAASRGNVLLYTAVRRVTLTMSVSAHGGGLRPATEPSVSSRANEVFFVHSGQIYARYLGGR